MTTNVKPVLVQPIAIKAIPVAPSNAALQLKRALVIANLSHTMSIAQLVGIYPA